MQRLHAELDWPVPAVPVAPRTSDLEAALAFANERLGYVRDGAEALVSENEVALARMAAQSERIDRVNRENRAVLDVILTGASAS